MSMVYGGQIQTMMPKLHSRNYAGMELIRPLYMVKEADIIRWVEQNDLHFIRCDQKLLLWNVYLQVHSCFFHILIQMGRKPLSLKSSAE